MEMQSSVPSCWTRTSKRTRRAGSAAVMRFLRYPSSKVEAMVAPARVLSHGRRGTRRAHEFGMVDISLGLPPLALLRSAVAAVWLYEGLWCKLLGHERHQLQVVEAVPKLGPIVGRDFLRVLGLVEVALAIWVMTGLTPGLCALAQTVLLVTLNANGLLWARHIIHDPAGMVVKNVPFLLLAWVAAAMSGGAS